MSVLKLSPSQSIFHYQCYWRLVDKPQVLFLHVHGLFRWEFRLTLMQARFNIILIRIPDEWILLAGKYLTDNVLWNNGRKGNFFLLVYHPYQTLISLKSLHCYTINKIFIWEKCVIHASETLWHQSDFTDGWNLGMGIKSIFIITSQFQRHP